MKYHWKTHDNISKFDADDDFLFIIIYKSNSFKDFGFILFDYLFIYFFNETSQASVKSDDYKKLHTFQWLSSSVIFFSYQNIFVVMTKGKFLLIPAVKSTGRQRLVLDYYRDSSGKKLKTKK